ncbi:MAG: ABC transporter ATP-binding protein [Pseudomonadota bacterium]
MPAILSIRDLVKTYSDGFEALKSVNLDIEQGEIIALLGPNGAGKTTLISTVCGITKPTSGTVTVGGHDILRDFRKARAMIGLVPQEISLEPFEHVINTVRFSRGLFGKPANDGYLDDLLDQLSLGDKKNQRIVTLSGGMKRRVLIAKALSHEPNVLFLDEPTAGVDVELRKDMWQIVEGLRRNGTTIILTTHYIEEAEAIADRVAVINKGEIVLVEGKDDLITRMGQKELRVDLHEAVTTMPPALAGYDLEIGADGHSLVYRYDATAGRTGITRLLNDLSQAGLHLRDIETRQSTLEEIFVGLVREPS